MYLLTSPIHYVKKKRARRRRLQTVLHMLSASGVVRLGHVEPRYFVASAQVDALYRQDAKRQPMAASTAMRSTAGFDWPRLRQLVLTMRPSRLQIEQ
jgi:hypothetical protein